jgi:hypothetical protein
VDARPSCKMKACEITSVKPWPIDETSGRPLSSGDRSARLCPSHFRNAWSGTTRLSRSAEFFQDRCLQKKSKTESGGYRLCVPDYHI